MSPRRSDTTLDPLGELKTMMAYTVYHRYSQPYYRVVLLGSYVWRRGCDSDSCVKGYKRHLPRAFQTPSKARTLDYIDILLVSSKRSCRVRQT